MKVTDFLKGKFILVKNEVENKKSILEIEKVEQLEFEKMIYDKDGWENGSRSYPDGFLVHFTNGYKRKYDDLMSIDFYNPSIDVKELDVNDFK